MANFLKKAFSDMKESAKAQHEVDKANFEAAKAESKANFEEKEKGSLEVGKFADFVIMEKDMLELSADQILKNKVWKTYVNGEKVFERVNK